MDKARLKRKRKESVLAQVRERDESDPRDPLYVAPIYRMELDGTKAKDKAWDKHSRDIGRLVRLIHEAKRQGITGRIGDPILLDISIKRLMAIWCLTYNNPVQDTLTWLEDHGWLESYRYKCGKRTGTYCLGAIAQGKRHRDSGIHGRRYTKWMKGQIL